MKRIVASVGLVAVGASGVHAASVAALTSEGTKPWSVSATLRGFYDDNVSTASTSLHQTKSFGFEISPAFNLNWAVEQTSMSLGYVYSFKYYEKKPPLIDPSNGQPLSTDKDDQTHSFKALLNHVFSERYVLNVQDSFVVGQEADLLRAGNALTGFQRVPGDNIRNYGTITFNAELTRLFGAELGYNNTFFHYDDEGGDSDSPSRAGVLDRLEHYVHIDGRWKLQPQTVGVLGYRYGQVDYTADEEVVRDVVTQEIYKSDVRNSRSHYGYLGADHAFRPDLAGTVRLGARYTDYYNEPGHPSDIGPSAQASLTYTYAPESSFLLGIGYDISASDLVSAKNGHITTDAESTVVYGTITHRIMPRLFGSVTGQFQNSSLNGGIYENDSERYYLLGLNVEYRFNTHLSAHAGYNYDKLDSEVGGRSFDRNRVYVGVTASY